MLRVGGSLKGEIAREKFAVVVCGPRSNTRPKESSPETSTSVSTRVRFTVADGLRLGFWNKTLRRMLCQRDRVDVIGKVE